MRKNFSLFTFHCSLFTIHYSLSVVVFCCSFGFLYPQSDLEPAPETKNRKFSISTGSAGFGFSAFSRGTSNQLAAMSLSEIATRDGALVSIRPESILPDIAEPPETMATRESPPIDSFPGQLLQNFKGLFSKHNLKPVLIGAAATGVSSLADQELRDYFSEPRRVREVGDVGAIVGHPLTLGGFAGGMLLWSYQTENDRFRAMGFSLTQGFIVNGTMTLGLKALVRRTRPNGEDRASFPSGHTSGVFTTAVVVSHYYHKAAIPAYVVAGLVGFSRVERNKHYLSDVVAGATLGIIVGQTVCRQTDIFRTGPLTWMPTLVPEGGFAVAVYLNSEQ